MARILVVDDEKYIRHLYRQELSEEGHEVSTMASGHQVLRKINQLRPHVVILDIKLKDHNGLKLLEEIRSENEELPVILCTAYDAFRGDVRTDLANYYVVKTINLSELKLAVQVIIEGETFLP